MSIREMIREHPSVGDDYNDALGEAVKHAMYCAAICNSCADACSAEDMDLRDRIGEYPSTCAADRVGRQGPDAQQAQHRPQ